MKSEVRKSVQFVDLGGKGRSDVPERSWMYQRDRTSGSNGVTQRRGEFVQELFLRKDPIEEVFHREGCSLSPDEERIRDRDEESVEGESVWTGERVEKEQVSSVVEGKTDHGSGVDDVVEGEELVQVVHGEKELSRLSIPQVEEDREERVASDEREDQVFATRRNLHQLPSLDSAYREDLLHPERPFSVLEQELTVGRSGDTEEGIEPHLEGDNVCDVTNLDRIKQHGMVEELVQSHYVHSLRIRDGEEGMAVDHEGLQVDRILDRHFNHSRSTVMRRLREVDPWLERTSF